MIYRTEHELRMCFDEDYEKKYVIFVKERKQILLLYVEVFKNPHILVVYTILLIFISNVFGIMAGILLPLIIHTLAWASVAIPEYVKIKRKLGI